MKTLKRITVLYISSKIAFTVISKLFGEHISVTLKSIYLWILPTIIIAIVGQIIGFLVFLAIERPAHLKQRVYNISYSIAFLVFLTLAVYFKYSSWQHQKHFGNIEDNQRHFLYFAGPNKVQEEIAFDSLSKIMVDPNSFLLKGGSIKAIDTVIDGISDTLYLTTLRYKKENKETILKAKFAVFSNSAQLIFYDIPLDSHDNYTIDSLGKTVIKNFNDAMKVVPDSMKEEIRKDFGDIMDK